MLGKTRNIPQLTFTSNSKFCLIGRSYFVNIEKLEWLEDGLNMNTLREGIVAEINVLNLVGALPEGMGRGP